MSPLLDGGPIPPISTNYTKHPYGCFVFDFIYGTVPRASYPRKEGVMIKMLHVSPPGFTRRHEPGSSRITFRPGISAQAVHARFLGQVHTHPLSYSDPGKDVVDHVRKGHRYFFSTDLISAFDQVSFQRLRKALFFRSIPPGWLTPQDYFFHENGRGGLIQGAPSSPYLFETYCRFGGLDVELFEYCDKLGFHYSRYVDDILISSSRPLGKRIGPSIRKIVSTYGFSLSDRKTKRVDVFSEPLEVLGYVIHGNRVDAGSRIIQQLFDPDQNDASRQGLFAWRRHVRKLSRRR